MPRKLKRTLGGAVMVGQRQRCFSSLPAVAVSDTNLDHMTQTEYAQNSVKILRQSEILPLFSKLDLKEEGEEIYIQYRLRRPSLVLWFVIFHLPNVILRRCGVSNEAH